MASDGRGARRTKIVGTLGPATSTPQGVRALIKAGLDVVRLNFSHGHREEHRQTIRLIRAVSEEMGTELGILQDLGGPKIRLGEIGAARQLRPGENIILMPGGDASGDQLPVSYPYLIDDVSIGERVLLADGEVELKVIRKDPGRLLCEVLVGGRIASRKGVNLPGANLRVPSVTAKDLDDLRVGLEEGVDFVALSFVRHERDVVPVAEAIAEATSRPLLIAKIEKPEALQRFTEILKRVDGVMVARGDLGVEMPVEEVPMIQKRIIEEARQAAKPVITATQMLRSMVSCPRPLRAEATDVANAILDGSDALMLSEETAIGRYPVQAVAMMDRIACAVEPQFETRALLDQPIADSLPATAGALSRAACMLARDVEAAAVIACTTSGSTARLVARVRPPIPVVALTASTAVQRQLCLSWGVTAARGPVFSDTDSMFERALEWVSQQGMAMPGDRVVVTAGLPINLAGTTNLLRVMELTPNT